jgi:hypothetical protein
MGVETAGAGAAATTGGVAAGQGGNAAGRDNNITINNPAYPVMDIRSYLKNKGPQAAHGMGNPALFWTLVLEGTIEVEKLRETLLSATPEYVTALKDQPARLVSVTGLLYPCGLLVSGWWESRFDNADRMEWNNGIQAWLFNGFHSWGPSFDYSWDFDGSGDASRPAYIAQLATGDEANSIPVIIPAEKAKKLRAAFQEKGHAAKIEIGPLVVTVQGVLCHRNQCPEAAVMGKIGGILDYCIWLKEGEPTHKISVDKVSAKMYSGYLWKCIAPKDSVDQGKPLAMDQAYFVWEHTNVANEDSVKYNLDSLEHKAAYIRREFHDNAEFVVLQKSNVLVRGEPVWSKEQFYNCFLNREEY